LAIQTPLFIPGLLGSGSLGSSIGIGGELGSPATGGGGRTF